MAGATSRNHGYVLFAKASARVDSKLRGEAPRVRLTYDTGAEAMTRPPLVRPEWVSSDGFNTKAVFRPCPQIPTPITRPFVPHPMGVNM